MLVSGVDSRLNIVHVIEPGSGGAMRHVLDLARAQADTSHAVSVIYSPLRLEAGYEAQLQALVNVKLYPLPMHHAPHVADVGSLWGLVKILRAEKPDILHAHSTKAGLLARLARLFVKTHVVYTPHGMMSLNPEMPKWKKKIYGAYEKVMSCLTDRMVVLSFHEFESAQSLGLGKLTLAQNGVTPAPVVDRSALRAVEKIQPEQLVVGFVGRMAFPKNPSLAVAAFAKAKKQLPNLLLYMIGDGELRLGAQQMAKNLGIAADVHWLGAVDARGHYAAMDVLLVTSSYEGMPYSFLEALSAGVPIVTTNVGGSETCVIPGQTGEVTDFNADALADGLVKVLGDATMHDALRFTARARARQFGIPQMLESVMAAYAATLATIVNPSKNEI